MQFAFAENHKARPHTGLLHMQDAVSFIPAGMS